jgi:hypothetical protein
VTARGGTARLTEALEEAEIEATLAQHDEWVAARRPGALSDEEVMAELLNHDQ